MDIIVYTDDKRSWFVNYGKKLEQKFKQLGHKCEYVFKKENLRACDVNFMLSCTKLVPIEKLKLNRNNIVVHASDLPKGKGFSPLQWQILEGNNNIPLTLFEAAEDVDSGDYYLKSFVKFEGHELLNELRAKMAEKIIEMCVDFIRNFDTYKPVKQVGEETFYQRRKEKDDELDIDKSLKEHFNHFRIADNDKYPLYFRIQGKKYNLKISKAE